MLGRFSFKKLLMSLSALSILSISQCAFASVFQLWEQDGASIGNYHAGRAAAAEDASTAFYNPAGLVRIQNQQLVLGLDPVITNILFRGTVDVNTLGLGNTGAQPATAQGGTLNLVPDLHYAAPISDRLVLGMSIFYPFGLQNDYGTDSFARYASTLTSLKVIDFSPSLGFSITDKFSIGAGLDVEHASLKLNLASGNQLVNQSVNQKVDSYLNNTGADYAYGFHLGALYQFTPDTRAGLSYQSKVIHILHGNSQLSGPLANNNLGGVQYSPYLRAKLPLPPATTFSLFHTFNSVWDAMASLTYTQWNILQDLVLTGVAGTTGNNTTINFPQNYKNTWNYSIGANYHLNEQWFFRSGVGYDQSPSNNQDRSLQFPDSNRIAVALGAHCQVTKTLGFDAGWTHLFVMNTRINNTTTVGDQAATVVGSVHSSADVYGLQMRWDIT